MNLLPLRGYEDFPIPPLHKKLEGSSQDASKLETDKSLNERRGTMKWGNFQLPTALDNTDDTKPPSPNEDAPRISIGGKKVEFPPDEEAKSKKSVISSYRKRLQN